MTRIINHCENVTKVVKRSDLDHVKNSPPSQNMVLGLKELPWPLLKPTYASTETVTLVFVSTETKTLYSVSTETDTYTI